MRVGYALEIMPMTATSDNPEYDTLDFRFTVLDLESHPVPVDTVTITVLQDANGDLSIAQTKIEETAPTSNLVSWKECHGKTKCLQELLFARLRTLMAGTKARMMDMAKPSRKGCHGKHKGKVMGHPGPNGSHGHYEEGPDGMPSGPGHHAHAHGFGSTHSHHRHEHHGAFARTFSRIVHFIVVPAILGVLAGLTASAVGMLVGQAVVFLWQRYRGTNSAERKAAWEQGEACEKQGLMPESTSPEDVLPEYTESSQVRGSLDKN